MGAVDKSKNAAQRAKGKVKETAGKATGNERLRRHEKLTRPKPSSSKPARRSRTPSGSNDHVPGRIPGPPSMTSGSESGISESEQLS